VYVYLVCSKLAKKHNVMPDISPFRRNLIKMFFTRHQRENISFFKKEAHGGVRYLYFLIATLQKSISYNQLDETFGMLYNLIAFIDNLKP
jgi:hypothetical protein